MPATEWVALLGAVGIGAIATKLLDVVWLQRVLATSERTKWLREQRYRAYSELTRELVAGEPFHNEPNQRQFMLLVADALLVTTEPQLVRQLENYLPEAIAARTRLDHFTNNGTSTVEERTALRSKEEVEIRARADRIIQGLRDAL
jgi:hypothetical protein